MALSNTELLKSVWKFLPPGGASPGMDRLLFLVKAAEGEEQKRRFEQLYETGDIGMELDEDHDTLQWRILTYLQRKKWLGRPDSSLRKAYNSAKRANVLQMKRQDLGGHGAEKTIKSFRRLFRPAEELLCQYAAVDGSFPAPYTVNDFTQVIERAYAKGKGIELIEFLWKLRKNHRRRGQKRLNPSVFVMSLMWVDPKLPLWLMPSRFIGGVVGHALELKKAPSSASINAAIGAANLSRLAPDIAAEFFKSQIDSEGKMLHQEINQEVKRLMPDLKFGLKIGDSFRGRRAGQNA